MVLMEITGLCSKGTSISKPGSQLWPANPPLAPPPPPALSLSAFTAGALLNGSLAVAILTTSQL